MGYYVTIQKNPHDDVGPCYSEGDASNVVELQFDDGGIEAEALHELIGVVVGRGSSLDADAIEDYQAHVARLRERLPDTEGGQESPDLVEPIRDPDGRVVDERAD